MRPLSALMSCMIISVATGDVILTVEPQQVRLDEPTDVVLSLSAIDAYAVVVESIAFDFDGGGEGRPTDQELVITDFTWIGKLDDPTGVCARSDLPEPYTKCTDLMVAYGRSTPVAIVTLVGSAPGLFDLAANAVLVDALDGSAIHVAGGDPAAIKVVPEPPTLLWMAAWTSLYVGRRRFGIANSE